MNNHKIKLELTIDELILIMFCIRNSILSERNADLAAILYERLDKVISGI
jgi:hypothetical protein